MMSRGIEHDIDGSTDVQDLINFASLEEDEENLEFMYDSGAPVSVKDDDSVKLFIGQVSYITKIKQGHLEFSLMITDPKRHGRG